MPTPVQLEELAVALGPAGLLTRPDDVARYCEPYRGRVGTTDAVVRPSTVDEVREVVRWARRHRVHLLPQGAISGLVGASTPPPGTADSGPVVVTMERLDRAPVVDPVDSTAIVTAGTRLSRLQEAAAPHGLTLPIDLGADPSIGGMVATNTGGARMLRHGDVRRHVLGVRAVIADESCSVVDELSTLRKHNMGPSLSHLLVGSSGAYGIITDVALALERLPESRACAWCTPRDPQAALEALMLLEHRYGQWLEAFEGVSAEALDAALAHGSSVRPFGDAPSPPLSLLIEFAGGVGAEDELLRGLTALSDDGFIVDGVVVDPDRAWIPRHLVSEGLRNRGTVLGFDVSVPRPALPAFRARVRSAVHEVAPRVVVADFGHWADGGVHCNLVLVEPEDDETVQRLREIVLGTAVREFGGSFSAEHGIGPSNSDWWSATVPAPVRDLTGAIKEVVDPLGVLGHPGLPYGRASLSAHAGAPDSSIGRSSSAGTGRENR